MSVKEELEHLMKTNAPAPEPIKPEISKPVAKPKRTLGNIYVALEAQRIYNPGMPSVPSPAPANTFEKGITPALDTSGAWGQPEKK
jgi:hypothetical protein